ncbi:MAG: type II CRISPR RNA-guided endonuclease Cas9 [Opitutae bacterium]|nr:type II CRISPR RNA-guided endonuclease Cas9 [Opitutae bacterium]
MSTPYRLGLDLGTNSIGWAMMDLDATGRPVAIRRMGSRIFSDGRIPKTGESLAAARTKARGQRVRRERFLARRTKLLTSLTSLGLFPDETDQIARRNLATLDPYELRAKALDGALHPWHLGRALLHLAKRRGFKSNRLAGDDDEAQTTGFGIERLKSELGSSTLGQLLHQRLEAERNRLAVDSKSYKRESIRFRPEEHKPKSEKFAFYPTRQMYADEFAAINTAQAPHQKISAADWRVLRDIIFNQLPLRPQSRGGCRFLKDADGKPLPRARLALASFQEFQILSDACHLRYRNTPLDPVQRLDARQRATVLEVLRCQAEVKFSSLRTKLRLPEESRFTIESKKREKLEGDRVGKQMSAKNIFGGRWHKLTLTERDAIVARLLDTEQADQVRAYAEAEWGLSPEAAQALADLPAKKFPLGFAPFSQRFLHHIVPELEAGIGQPEGISYTEAVVSLSKKLDFVDPLVPADGSAPELPYYGQAMPESCVRVLGNQFPLLDTDESKASMRMREEREFGRFPNPTVHIALNQLRVVVNTLIRKHGKPAQISLEITRDLKLSREARRKVDEQQTENKKLNEARDQRIEQIAKEQDLDLATDYDNRLRLRLWEEQQDGASHFCPYTGRNIPLKILFSDQIEVDHILPFALTRDDSPANKVLCFRDANRIKRKRSPFEAFGTSPEWSRIEQLAALLPPNKLWRFGPDAMEKFNTEEFSAKQLHDTRHLSKAARRYLTTICPEHQVNVYPGRLTALLRHHWGLETILAPEDDPDRIGKNRSDHRHHAIDALVVALADRTTLQRITLANQNDSLHGIVIPAPWPMIHDVTCETAVSEAKSKFRAEVAAAVAKIVVSHRPDHNPAGGLHEDKFYGPVRPIPDDESHGAWRKERGWEQEHEYDLVYRVKLDEIRHAHLDVSSTTTGCVRDRKLRERLAACLADVPKPAGKQETVSERKARLGALHAFAQATHVRTVRLVKKKASIPLPHAGQAMERSVIPGGVHCITFWRLPDGAVTGVALNLFEATKVFPPNGRPAHDEVWHRRHGIWVYRGMRPHPAAQLLFTVHKHDTLLTKLGGETRVVWVSSIAPSEDNQQLWCFEHTSSTKGRKWNIAFGRILKTETRLVHVDPIGDVRDPGPLK